MPPELNVWLFKDMNLIAESRHGSGRAVAANQLLGMRSPLGLGNQTCHCGAHDLLAGPASIMQVCCDAIDHLVSATSLNYKGNARKEHFALHSNRLDSNKRVCPFIGPSHKRGIFIIF